MTQKRPVSMLVFGILNLVLGPIGLAGSCCCGVAAFGTYAAVTGAYQDMKPEQKADLEGLDELWKILAEHLPGIVPYVVASLLAGLILSLIQTISGIGLVMVRGWGRWLCAFWAFFTVISNLASLAYCITVLTPGFQKSLEPIETWMQKMEEKQRQMGKAPPPRKDLREVAPSGNPLADNFMLIVFSVVHTIYAALAFIFMILPSTGAAIARYHGVSNYSSQGSQDDPYDDDYLRRRRDLDEPPSGPGPPGM